MTIREYFEALYNAIDAEGADWAMEFTDISDEETRVWRMYEMDEPAYEAWCAEHGVEPYTEDTTLWAWDMCGE